MPPRPWRFEKQEKYQERKPRDRFTFDMLREYLGHLGLAPFDEDFSVPPGTSAWMVERTGPVLPIQQEFTLAAARQHMG